MSPVTAAVNVYRQKHGLKSLKEHHSLMESANGHSDDMAKHNKMSHTGSDGSSPFQRMKRGGYNYQYAGECVAWGQHDAQTVVDAWMSDLPHRAILLGSHFTHMGVGEKNKYWTADFASGMPDDKPLPVPLQPDDFDLW